MKIDRRNFILGASAFSLLPVAACDRTSPGSQRAIPPVNDTVLRLSETEAMDVVAAQSRYKVAVLFPFQGIPFWVNEAYGLFDQADKSGIDLIWRSADGYENVDRQVQQLSEMKALGVDAVLLGATNFAGTRAAVNDLIASNIPVINHVTSTDSDKISSRVLVDYKEIGQKQAQHIKERLPEGGQILMLNGPAGAEWSGNEVEGFKEIIGSDGAWDIVAERNSNPDRVEAQRFIEDLIVRFPDAAAIFSVTDSLAMGAVDALRGAGKDGTVVVTTAGFSPETVEPIKNGSISLNVDESPVLIGRSAINAVVNVLNGNEVAGTQFAPTPSHTAASLSDASLSTQWAPEGWTLP